MSQRLQSTGVRVRMVVIGALMGAVWPGCGTGDFVPPPPPSRGDAGAGGATGSTAGSPSATKNPFVTGGTVRSIDMILAGGLDAEEAEVERSTARSQAGFEKARLHILPDNAASPDRSAASDQSQAELARGAIARKPQALIVEPDDPADEGLARAIHEVRTAKVPVVVIGGPIAGTSQSPGLAPLIVVKPEPFADSARQLVALSIRNARNAKLDPQGGALLLIAEPSDRLLAERVAAVRAVLKESKIGAVEELRFPKKIDKGVELLKKRLQADAKAAMVFFFDLNGATVSNNVAGDIAEKRPFIQAGYTSDNSLPRMALAGEFAAVAEYLPNRVIQRAITTAVAAAQGRSVKEKEELPILVIASPPTAGAPRLQAAQNRLRSERSKGGD